MITIIDLRKTLNTFGQKAQNNHPKKAVTVIIRPCDVVSFSSIRYEKAFYFSLNKEKLCKQRFNGNKGKVMTEKNYDKNERP